jgi:hypothetical protein
MRRRASPETVSNLGSGLAGVGFLRDLRSFSDLLHHPVTIALLDNPLDVERDVLLVRDECVGSERSCSYSKGDISIRSVQVSSAHWQIHSDGACQARSSRLRSLRRSFTSRNSASFSPVLSS